MSGRAWLAFGNARVRAMKSRLLGADDALALRSAGARTLSAVLGQLGLAGADIGDVSAAMFRSLIESYETVLRSYPSGFELFRAMLRLHEVENLKLAWRAVARSIPVDRWSGYWRPLGRLAVLRREDWREAGSLRHVLPLVRGTPYAGVVNAAFRSYAQDPVAAEMAFDRWASVCLVEAAARLPGRDEAARDLVLAVVRARDLDSLHRGATTFGLSADLAVNTTALLRDEADGDRLRRLAEWRPESGPLGPLLSRRWVRDPGRIPDWDALRLALRRARREACRRAFLGDPYQLAPAVAFLLLKEGELAAVTALMEAAGDAAMDGVLEGVLAASLMGG